MATAQEQRELDALVKSAGERITKTAKSMGSLCQEIGAYNRFSASIRDTGDKMSVTVNSLANIESHSASKKLLQQLSQEFANVEDYRDAQIKRIQAKVLDPLKIQGESVKNAKTELKNASAAQKKVLAQQKKLTNVETKNPSNVNEITLAKNSLHILQRDASKHKSELANTIKRFEDKRSKDLKNILEEFINIEMIFHAKVLEVYSRAFNTIDDLDTEASYKATCRDLLGSDTEETSESTDRPANKKKHVGPRDEEYFDKATSRRPLPVASMAPEDDYYSSEEDEDEQNGYYPVNRKFCWEFNLFCNNCELST